MPMPKSLKRIIVFLLIPNLLADPAFVSRLCAETNGSRPRVPSTSPTLNAFTVQAIVSDSLNAIDPMLSPMKKRQVDSAAARIFKSLVSGTQDRKATGQSPEIGAWTGASWRGDVETLWRLLLEGNPSDADRIIQRLRTDGQLLYARWLNKEFLKRIKNDDNVHDQFTDDLMFPWAGSSRASVIPKEDWWDSLLITMHAIENVFQHGKKNGLILVLRNAIDSATTLIFIDAGRGMNVAKVVHEDYQRVGSPGYGVGISGGRDGSIEIGKKHPNFNLFWISKNKRASPSYSDIVNEPTTPTRGTLFGLRIDAARNNFVTSVLESKNAETGTSESLEQDTNNRPQSPGPKALRAPAGEYDSDAPGDPARRHRDPLTQTAARQLVHEIFENERDFRLHYFQSNGIEEWRHLLGSIVLGAYATFPGDSRERFSAFVWAKIRNSLGTGSSRDVEPVIRELDKAFEYWFTEGFGQGLKGNAGLIQGKSIIEKHEVPEYLTVRLPGEQTMVLYIKGCMIVVGALPYRRFNDVPTEIVELLLRVLLAANDQIPLTAEGKQFRQKWGLFDPPLSSAPPASVLFLKALKDGKDILEALRLGKKGLWREVGIGTGLGALSILSGVGIIPSALILPALVFISALVFAGYHWHLLKQIKPESGLSPPNARQKFEQAFILVLYALTGLTLALIHFFQGTLPMGSEFLAFVALASAPLAHYLFDQKIFNSIENNARREFVSA